MTDPLNVLYTSHMHILIPESMDAELLEEDPEELEYPLFI